MKVYRTKWCLIDQALAGEGWLGSSTEDEVPSGGYVSVMRTLRANGSGGSCFALVVAKLVRDSIRH